MNHNLLTLFKGSQQTDSKTATHSKTGLNKQASLSLSHTHDGKGMYKIIYCYIS